MKDENGRVGQALVLGLIAKLQILGFIYLPYLLFSYLLIESKIADSLLFLLILYLNASFKNLKKRLIKLSDSVGNLNYLQGILAL